MKILLRRYKPTFVNEKIAAEIDAENSFIFCKKSRALRQRLSASALSIYDIHARCRGKQPCTDSVTSKVAPSMLIWIVLKDLPVFK